jgi:selenide,water dikinase
MGLAMAENSPLRLTAFSPNCGCAAKVGAQSLHEIMHKLPVSASKDLLVGTETFDDAAVYRLDKDIAIVQTVDFFPPVVDDPYFYGQISAANALSDVYAMGGKPLTCLAIVCFPTKKLRLSVLELILKGGQDKVRESGAIIVGGHTIQDEQPKYGLAVTGIISPDKVITNANARPGDCLVLTKPLGTGIIVTAAKAEIAKPTDLKDAIDSMCLLNRSASEIMQEIGVNACTDVTGFSLLGHLHQMAKASCVSAQLYTEHIPVLGGAVEYAKLGMIPEGAYNNRNWLNKSVSFSDDLEQFQRDILFDPQTSGGLLISVTPKKSARLLYELHKTGLKDARIIGKICKGKKGSIKVLKND